MTIILLSAIGLFGLVTIGVPLLIVLSHVTYGDARRATHGEQSRW